MFESLNDFREISRPLHITLGFCVLALFWVQIFSKKGSRFHVAAGRLFYWAGLAVAATAAFGVIAVLFNAWTSGNDVELADSRVAAVFFLGYLSIIGFVILEKGRSAIRFRGPSPGWRAAFAYARAGFAISASIALVAYAIIFRPANAILLFALSPLGLFIFLETLSFQRKGNDYPQRWIIEHLDGMFGAGIAFHTAFLVFGASRFMDPLFAGSPLQLIPWILPTLIGVPAGAIWKRRVLNAAPATA